MLLYLYLRAVPSKHFLLALAMICATPDGFSKLENMKLHWPKLSNASQNGEIFQVSYIVYSDIDGELEMMTLMMRTKMVMTMMTHVQCTSRDSDFCGGVNQCFGCELIDICLMTIMMTRIHTYIRLLRVISMFWFGVIFACVQCICICICT